MIVCPNDGNFLKIKFLLASYENIVDPELRDSYINEASLMLFRVTSLDNHT